jgi:hypothetical protein
LLHASPAADGSGLHLCLAYYRPYLLKSDLGLPTFAAAKAAAAATLLLLPLPAEPQVKRSKGHDSKRVQGLHVGPQAEADLAIQDVQHQQA